MLALGGMADEEYSLSQQELGPTKLKAMMDRKKCHLRGPAMVCLIEPSVNDGEIKDKMSQLVHGTAIIIMLHEKLRDSRDLRDRG